MSKFQNKAEAPERRQQATKEPDQAPHVIALLRLAAQSHGFFQRKL